MINLQEAHADELAVLEGKITELQGALNEKCAEIRLLEEEKKPFYVGQPGPNPGKPVFDTVPTQEAPWPSLRWAAPDEPGMLRHYWHLGGGAGEGSRHVQEYMCSYYREGCAATIHIDSCNYNVSVPKRKKTQRPVPHTCGTEEEGVLPEVKVEKKET